MSGAGGWATRMFPALWEVAGMGPLFSIWHSPPPSAKVLIPKQKPMGVTSHVDPASKSIEEEM